MTENGELTQSIITALSNTLGLIAVFVAFLFTLAVVTSFLHPFTNHLLTTSGFDRIPFFSFASLTLSAASLATVFAILLQVNRQGEIIDLEEQHLSHFEPTLNLYPRDENGTSVEKEKITEQEGIRGWFVVFNSSQTATIINGAHIIEFPDTRVRATGLELERSGRVRNEDDYENNIPIRENDGILFKFRVVEKEWDTTPNEISQVIEEGYLTIVIEGEFGQEEFEIDVR